MKLAFELPQAQAEKLRDEAKRLGLAPEELARAALATTPRVCYCDSGGGYFSCGRIARERGYRTTHSRFRTTHSRYRTTARYRSTYSDRRFWVTFDDGGGSAASSFSGYGC